MSDESKQLQEDAQTALLKAAKAFADKAAQEKSAFAITLLDSASRAFLAATGRTVDPPPDPGKQAK